MKKTWFGKTFAVSFALSSLVASLVTIGCGPAGSSSTSNNRFAQNPGQIVPVPAGACAGYHDVTFLPVYVQNALIGNYSGTFNKLDQNFNMVNNVPYTLTVTRAQTQGTTQTYLYMNFSANTPDAGMVSFQSCLDFQWPPAYSTNNSDVIYSMMSQVIKNASISANSFQFQLDIAVNGSNFDPAQSSISILDCGLSQGVFCSNPSTDVSFNNDLVKR